MLENGFIDLGCKGTIRFSDGETTRCGREIYRAGYCHPCFCKEQKKLSNELKALEQRCSLIKQKLENLQLER